MMNFEWDLPYGLRRIPVFAGNVVATTQPLAAQAGLAMLRQGGNAVDAAIATAATLTVVEPISCGLGSDGFVLVWDGERVRGLNMTGRSPAAMPEQFPGLDAVPWNGWETVTVPGVVAGWAALSKEFGRLPFARLFEPAVNYARDGFLVSPTIARVWGGLKLAFRKYPDIMRTYYPDGEPPEPGSLVKLPDHAKSLETIAMTSGEDLYRGRLAEKIVDHARNTGGWLSREDLAGHVPEWVEPLTIEYRGVELHEMPPNSQGLAVLSALGILNHFDLPSYPVDSADSIHLQIETLRVVLADLAPHVAEPAVMRVDAKSFLDADYLKRRAADIALDTARFPSRGVTADAGTTYVAAGDASGMMVSYIQSSGRGWGSGMVVPGTGIALSARGHWFSPDPAHPNRIGPGKRPFNTNIPALVTRDGRPVACFGLMGGHAQPHVHVQFMTRLIDYEQDPQKTVESPRWRLAVDEPAILVERGMDPAVHRELERRGHRIVATETHYPAGNSPFGNAILFGGAQMIYRLEDGYIAASDPRRDGQAVGF